MTGTTIKRNARSFEHPMDEAEGTLNPSNSHGNLQNETMTGTTKSTTTTSETTAAATAQNESENNKNSNNSSSSGGGGGGGGSATTSKPLPQDELRIAKEMAVAIAQNPNLTPDQIRELRLEKRRASIEARNKNTTTNATTPTEPKKSKSPMFKKGLKAAQTIKSAWKSAEKTIAKSTGVVVGGGNSSSGGGNSTSTGPSSPSPTSAGGGRFSAPKRSKSGDASLSAATSPRSLPSRTLAVDAAPSVPSAYSGIAAKSSGKRAKAHSSRDIASLSGIHSASGTTAGGTAIDQPTGSAAAQHQGLEARHSMTDSQQIRITGIVWKRRSGLGKYSASGAWERRRVVLKGSKLVYYRTLVDSRDEESYNSGDESGGEDVGPAAAPGAANAFDHGGKTGKSWFEQATAYSSSLVSNVRAESSGSARGYLDLVRERANVCASHGHSGAPTPFAMSIKVLAQTKWKLCFDTHAELMQWLAATTDVIVKGSVDSYNTQILQSHDPSVASDVYRAGGFGQLSEPPRLAAAGATSTGGHRLWITGHYSVKSENFPEAELEDVSEEDLEDVQSHFGDDENAEGVGKTSRDLATAAAGGLEFSLDPSTGRDVWAIPGESLWHAAMMFNLAIILARASSFSVGSFWYLITFTNIALCFFLKKEKVGGTLKPNMANISPKLARRLSSHGMIMPTTAGVASVTGDKNSSIIFSPEDTGDLDKSFTSEVKPVCGTTTMRIANPTDLPVNKDGHVFAGYRIADPAGMLVRSHGYKTTKVKVPSPGELYKCAYVDIFESRQRFPDMASRVKLPKVSFNDDGPKTWNAPDILVVSIAIPTDPPKLISSDNGGGYTVTIYFTMHQETRDILKRVTADGYDPENDKEKKNMSDVQKSKINAVRLLDEWCRRAPTDDAFMARFKVLPNAQNLKEIGLPAWIAKYNGKPFLIKRPGQTGFLYRHPDKSCLEFDISLHPFPYLAKQGICFMKDTYFKKVLVTFGFLIEGRSDDELPECLIGLMQLCYPDPIHAIQGEDFLSGKAPVSFDTSSTDETKAAGGGGGGENLNINPTSSNDAGNTGSGGKKTKTKRRQK